MIRTESHGGHVDKKGVHVGGSLWIYWICDTCGAELYHEKAVQKGWFHVDVGRPRRWLVCSKRCAIPILDALVAEFRSQAGVLL